MMQFLYHVETLMPGPLLHSEHEHQSCTADPRSMGTRTTLHAPRRLHHIAGPRNKRPRRW